MNGQNKSLLISCIALAAGVCFLVGAFVIYKSRSDTAATEQRREEVAEKERFQTELKDLLVDAEQLNLQAKEIFKNIVLKDRAHNEGDLDEAVRYEREVNRLRPIFTSQFVTLKTRFDHMKFPDPDTGRAELASAISHWERLPMDFTGGAAIEGETQFIQAKQRLEFYFH